MKQLVVPAKGPVAWVVEWILQPSIESLAQTATSRLDNGSTCRSAPQDHTRAESSFGAAERWHQDLRRQMKAMTSELSSHVGGLDVEIGRRRHSVDSLVTSTQMDCVISVTKFGERVQAVEPEPGNKTTRRVFSGYWLG
eukprot:6106164-Amphidinium_carterae.3